jgi:hypothetical protein
MVIILLTPANVNPVMAIFIILVPILVSVSICTHAIMLTAMHLRDVGTGLFPD